MSNHQTQRGQHGDERMNMSAIKHSSADHEVIEAEDVRYGRQVVLKLVKSGKIIATEEFKNKVELI